MKIPDYINITEKDNCLIAKDTRTNFAAKVKFEKEAIKIYGEEFRNSVIGNLIHKLEKKYNKSLPIDQRDGTNTPTDFTCPICLAKDKTLIIKAPEIGTYTSGIWYARRRYTTVNLQNVYECQNCKNQFTEEELNAKRLETAKSNQEIILFEQLQDGIITKEVYDDKLFEVRAGMTKQQYEAEREKEKKEYNGFGNSISNFSTKQIIAIFIGVLITGIVISFIFPEYNPCKKFGDDWSLERVAYRTKACVNSSGDIKYLNTK